MVPAMAADGADGVIIIIVVTVGGTRTMDPPVAGAGVAGAAAAAVEIVTKEVGDVEINPMAAAVAAGGIRAIIMQHMVTIAPVVVIGLTGKEIPMLVVRGIAPRADQAIDNTHTTVGVDGVSAVKTTIEVAVAVPLRGITLMGMPRPREIATETGPETDGQHRRETHHMAMVDRPS